VPPATSKAKFWEQQRRAPSGTQRNDRRYDNALYPESSVRRTLLEGCQSAVKVQPATIQIMLTTADSAQLWPGRNT